MSYSDSTIYTIANKINDLNKLIDSGNEFNLNIWTWNRAALICA